MVRKKRRSLIAAAIVTVVWVAVYLIANGRIPQVKNVYVKAATSVSSVAQLKEICKSGETKTISLAQKITLGEKIEVKGDIKIYGTDNSICRRATKGKEYKGELFSVEKGGSLTLENVVINGNCKNENLAGGVEGRMIVVQSGGLLKINDNCTLKQNYCSDCDKDAGGAIAIRANGIVEMTGGLICDNRSMTGGGAVRINQGGSFYLKGGEISGNSTKTKKNVEDYDGRGGGIHNVGTFCMTGGKIISNGAEGTRIGDTVIGGIGGGIYNKGVFEIKGGAVEANSSSNGGAGVYATDNSVVQMIGGEIRNNFSNDGMGGGLYINNGTKCKLLGGSIHNNQARTGGGIYISKEKSEVVMEAGLIYANDATGNQYALGGGIRNNGGVFTMKGGSIGTNPEGHIESNMSPNGKERHYASAIYVDGGRTELLHGRIANSLAEARTIVVEKGAAIWIRDFSLLGVGEMGILNHGIVYAGEGRTQPDFGGEYEKGIVNHGELYIYDGTWKGKKNALRNYGIAQITGGYFNASSAIHQESGAMNMSGGKCMGETYGVYHSGGQFCIGASAAPKSIFMKRGAYVDVLSMPTEEDTLLIPEDYEEGRVLAHVLFAGGSAELVHRFFKLKEKPSYYMKNEGMDLRIGVKRYYVKFHPNGGTGEISEQRIGCGVQQRLTKNGYKKVNCHFIGWSRKRYAVGRRSVVEWGDEEEVKDLTEQDNTITIYAVWREIPTIEVGRTQEYYEGESVPISYIKSDVTAKDKVDGELTDKVKLLRFVYENGDIITNPNELLVDEKHCGKVKAYFQAFNSSGYSKTKAKSIQIIKNSAPVISTRNRYFFLSEIQSLSDNQFERILRERMNVSDDVDNGEELKGKCLSLHTSGVDRKRPGQYIVTAEITDQYGNRPYMKQEERKRYGYGKQTTKYIRVTVIEDTISTEPKNHQGKVRFISDEQFTSLRPGTLWSQKSEKERLAAYLRKEGKKENIDSVWHFSAAHVKEVRAFAMLLNNPFSSKSNKEFLAKFEKEGLVWKGGEYE